MNRKKSCTKMFTNNYFSYQDVIDGKKLVSNRLYQRMALALVVVAVLQLYLNCHLLDSKTKEKTVESNSVST